MNKCLLTRLHVALALFGFAFHGSPFISRAIAQEEVREVEFVRPKLKDLDGHFPFAPPTSKEEWEKRAGEVRQQLRVALGIHPMPQLPKLQPIVHSPREMEDYRVEKVILESFPGLYITGTLYRPLETKPGSHPAMLCPHGHWANARFYDPGQAEIDRLLANGEERFANAARNHIQARCVQLARMGCVVFQWDMLGYSDSQQISMQRAHGFKGREAGDETNDQGWVLFSPEAEGHSQSVMGIQTVHTLRAVDFLAALPEVDLKRIGITGASGGGTQTFIAAALDPRISLAFPAVMVSTGMQGGCTCENACGLRVDTGNIEIAGLFAPKPMGMTAADDWTRTMAKDGFPELKKLYELLGAADRVALFPSIHFGHNYNHVSRVSMYGWVNRFFELGFPTPVLERDFEYLSGQDLTVWDEQHAKPSGGPELERNILRWWKDDAERQLLSGKDAPAIRREIIVGWDSILAPAQRLCSQLVSQPTKDGSIEVLWNGERLGLVLPKVEGLGGTGHGLHFADSSTSAKAAIEAAKAKASRVVQSTSAKSLGGDAVFLYLEDETRPQALVANPRRAAAYSFGYNPPLLVRKVAAVASVVRAMAKIQGKPSNLYATSEDAFVAAAVARLCKDEVASLTLTDDGGRLADAKDMDDPKLVPAGLRYFDWPGLVACLDRPVELKVTAIEKTSDWKRLGDAGLLKHVQISSAR